MGDTYDNDTVSTRRVQRFANTVETLQDIDAKRNLRRQYDLRSMDRRLARKEEKEIRQYHPHHAGADDYTSHSQGGGFIEGFIKKFYDEDKNGFQWANIGGGTVGLALGGLMGMGIAGAAGGGWLGTTATLLLAGAGLMFGSRLANDHFPSTPMVADAKGNTSPQVAQGKAPEQEQEVKTVQPTNSVDSVASLASAARPDTAVTGGVEAQSAALAYTPPPKNQPNTTGTTVGA